MAEIDTSRCPLCGHDNSCAMAIDNDQVKASACWCTKTKVPPQLIATVPAEQKGKACICMDCVEKFDLSLGYPAN